MAISLLGSKVGMTRVYNEDGTATPVTVLQMMPNRISQVKTVETDGYNAVQLTVGEKKASKVNKPESGHYAKASVQSGSFTRESRVDTLDSINHRTPGSIGQNQTPGRVFKGKKMSGHMGAVKQTTQNLTVLSIDAEKHLLLIKGAVPGSRGGNILVKTAVKG